MKKLFSVLLLFASTVGYAQTSLTTTAAKAMYASKSYKEVSVHDPSIAYDPSTKMYYLVGSHIAAASSSNLVDWTSINTGYEHSTFFNKSFRTAFSSCPSHSVSVVRNGVTTTETLPSFDAGAFCSIYKNDQGGWIAGDMWAPDIIYNPNMGKWCLYLSLNGDNWASVIVLMTADKPTGPFKYEAPIVFGGFNGQSYNTDIVEKYDGNGNPVYLKRKVDYKNTDLELVLGTQSSLPSRYNRTNWGTYFPNCIDPNVIFDDNGDLWLCYGSWSGGIFMLKLDKNTGLRDYTRTYANTFSSTATTGVEDPYFGKKIAGGWYVSGEGPYIQKIGDYYYLFMSYGFMVAGYDDYGTEKQKTTGGYEMRVFRSDNVDGPYKDAAGNSAVYTAYQLNYGKTSATNRGMRLLGAMNGWGTMKKGVTAQGHNSAIVDPNGNAYVVYHTKFENKDNRNYGHQVRVRQLLQNIDGWLCASPFRHTRTAGPLTTQEIINTKQIFSKKQLAGTYNLIMHKYKLDWANWEEVTPVIVNLNEDGTVTGAYTGKWNVVEEGKSYINITINSSEFKGVMLEQDVDGYASMSAQCISAVNKVGVPIWMYKYDAKASVAEAYRQVAAAFTATTISTNLPNKIPGATVEYSATSTDGTKDESSVLTKDGMFTPTNDGRRVRFVTNIFNDEYYIPQFTNSKLTLKMSYINKGVIAHYKLDSKTSKNLINNTDAITINRGSTGGIIPTIDQDEEKGSVLHQYFGAQANASYTRMPNPIYGTDVNGVTVSFWVKRVDANAYDALFSFFSGTTPAATGARFYFTGNTYAGYNDNANNWFDVNHASVTYTTIPVGVWTYVTLTLDKTKGYKLYINGVAQTNKAYSGSVAVTAFDYAAMMEKIKTLRYMYFGMGSFWGSANAYISDLIVFDEALPADEINYLYNRVTNNAYNPVMKGDVNEDGKVDRTDANIVVNSYLNRSLDGVNQYAADIDNDNIIDMSDANAILNIFLNK